jgi:HemY protein
LPSEPAGITAAPAAPPRPQESPAATESVPSPATASEIFAEANPIAEPASAKARRRPKAPSKVEPVIPLVHAPDDPGPIEESMSDTPVVSPAQSAWPRSA